MRDRSHVRQLPCIEFLGQFNPILADWSFLKIDACLASARIMREIESTLNVKAPACQDDYYDRDDHMMTATVSMTTDDDGG